MEIRAGLHSHVEITPLGDQSPGPYDGVPSYMGPVQEDGAHAHDDVVLHGAAVDDGVVPDGHAVTDDRGDVRANVDRDQVLDVGVISYDNRCLVGPDDGVVPDAAPGADGDIADDVGAGGCVYGWIDFHGTSLSIVCLAKASHRAILPWTVRLLLSVILLFIIVSVRRPRARTDFYRMCFFL